MAVNKVIYGGNTLVDLTGDTVTAADLADGVKATGADGNPVIGLMQKVTIDAELSTTSTNPVQNKVIKEAIDTVTASIPTKVSALENDAGYLTQHQSLDRYAKTSVANTWTAQQTFNKINIGGEYYSMHDVEESVSNMVPLSTASIGAYVTRATSFTLDMSNIVSNLKEGEATVFTAVVTNAGDSDSALIVNGIDFICYVGSAADASIARPANLINIFMFKLLGESYGVVQASKLEGVV